MPFRLWNFFALPGWAKVDTGECARLVQVMVPQVGHTSIWRPGERVLDVLARGGKIPPGTAVATFVNGRYPTAGHRHAAFYEGPALNTDGSLQGIILIDQWNPHATPWNPHPPARDNIGRRTAQRMGKMRPDGSFPNISDNAEAFYVIEH
jgi:hypothetical protein